MRGECYCEVCGAEIRDFDKADSYRSGPPYYETIYICEDCNGRKKVPNEELDGFEHIDMDGRVL